MWCSVRISHHLRHLLGDDGILTLPTAPGPAPRLNSSDADLDGWRRQLMPLTCAAGLAGLPQVSLPVATVDGLPVGVGLIGPAGSDESLLAISKQLMHILLQR
eukprot:jgi/Chrzof1/5795/Cz16g16050.t1